MMTTTYIHMNANNDKNGNPRRLFLATTTNSEYHPTLLRIEAIDEGYEGIHAVMVRHPGALYVTVIEISVSEYHRLLQRYPAGKVDTSTVYVR